MTFDHITYVKKDLTALYNPHTRKFVWSRWNERTDSWIPTGESDGLPGIGVSVWPDYDSLLDTQGEDFPTLDLLYWWEDDPDIWRIQKNNEGNHPLVIIPPDGTSIFPISIVTISKSGVFGQTLAVGPRHADIPPEIIQACRVIFDSM